MISAQLFLEKEQLKCVVAFTAYRSGLRTSFQTEMLWGKGELFP